jgi:hypothetical protein
VREGDAYGKEGEEVLALNDEQTGLLQKEEALAPIEASMTTLIPRVATLRTKFGLSSSAIDVRTHEALTRKSQLVEYVGIV